MRSMPTCLPGFALNRFVRSMPVNALLAVLVAALLHATWNLLVKASGDRLITAAAQVVLGGLVFLPLVIGRGFPTEATPFLIASALVQAAYIYALASAYDRAELSFVYPIARGSAPLVIALGSLFGLSVRPGIAGWVALALICGGVVAIGFMAPHRHGLTPSLWTGFLIALYISIDGEGVTRTEDLLAYIAALYALAALAVIPLALLLRGPRQAARSVAGDWPSHLGGGVASMASYGLLLYASRLAPLSLVSAARETAVVFAAIGGWWFLDERIGRTRAAAIAVIALGMVVLALTR